MSFNLGLVRNFSNLGLAAKFNHSYLNHVMAIITIDFPLRHELHSNIL